MTKIYARVKPIACSTNSLMDITNVFFEAIHDLMYESIADCLIEGASFYRTLEGAKNSFRVTKDNQPFFSYSKYDNSIQDSIIEFELDEENNIKALGEAHKIKEIEKTYEKCLNNENQSKKVFTPVWMKYSIEPEDMSNNALAEMNKQFLASELFKSYASQEVATAIAI